MPEQLSIMGFDGLPHGALFYPALSTVAAPMQEIGRVACQRLIESIGVPERMETIEFPMQLLVRESTAAPPNLTAKPRHLRPVS